MISGSNREQYIASGQYIISNIIKNEQVDSMLNPPDKRH